MGRTLLFILTFTILASPVFSAMSPVGPFCVRNGHDLVSILNGTYEGELVQRLTYQNPRKEIFRYNDTELDVTDLSGYDVNKNLFGIGTTRLLINWETYPKTYCIFTDGNRCIAEDFFEGTCGAEYKIDKLLCVKEEVVFNFEECCDGYQRYLACGMAGQPYCRVKPNIFKRAWEHIRCLFPGGIF